MRLAASLATIVLACAEFLACKAPSRESALPIPMAEPPREAPTGAVDGVLRTTFKSYVGLSTDEEGAVRLTLAEASEFASAVALAKETWVRATRDEVGRTFAARFTFVQASAGPEELSDAFTKMRDVLTLAKVIFLDLDEACGCIMVGVVDAATAAQVGVFATQHGVPQTLVKTAITKRIVRLQSLTGSLRPTMAGVQVENRRTMQCTIGLPTWSFNLGKYGFLTASHCTEGPQGGSGGTRFYQPGGSFFGSDGVANETTDPVLFDNSQNSECPMGRRCRYSDVAFAEYDQQDLGIIGRVARPGMTCTMRGTSCDVAMQRATDDIRLRSGIIGLREGDEVDKVGRSTGWTRGRIIATCLNHNIHDEDGTDTMMTMLCQTFVAATGGPGDSGSPVFTFHPASGTGEFAGILSGGAKDPDMFVFTPIENIERELGGFVYNQAGLNGAFASDGLFYTSDVADQIAVDVETDVVPLDEVQFVLNLGPGLNERKEIVLAEGTTPPASGAGRWPLAVDNQTRSASNGLYTYQLANGRLEFRKQRGSGVVEVSRVPIDTLKGGTRITFSWNKQ